MRWIFDLVRLAGWCVLAGAAVVAWRLPGPTIATSRRSSVASFMRLMIIPAAVLLSEVVDAVESVLGPARSPLRIKSMKFPAPARPGSRLVIDYLHGEAGTVRLVCRVEAAIVLTGEIMWGGAPEP